MSRNYTLPEKYQNNDAVLLLDSICPLTKWRIRGVVGPIPNDWGL